MSSPERGVFGTAEEFLHALGDATERATGTRRELSVEQRAVVIHPEGPLMVVAGPGTGKTEAIVLRTLRLLLVDGLSPQSIVLTTFTERAAREMADRAARYLEYLRILPAVESKDLPDLSQVWTGTLHSLALRMLREYSPNHEDLTVMGEVASHFLFLSLTKTLDLTGPNGDQLYSCLTGKQAGGWVTRIKRAKTLREFFARLTEDDVTLSEFWETCDSIPAPTLQRLQELYHTYHEVLGPDRVDLAGLQRTFLDFIESRWATDFLYGRTERALPGIREVIVDEYQDTNAIQEAIYFGLARAHNNLLVVGDDDQALYRFRGASVELFLEFEKRCRSQLGMQPTKVYLSENRRSHAAIVTQLNQFTSSAGRGIDYKRMREGQKPFLSAKATIGGPHSPVCVISEVSEKEIALVVADTVKELWTGGFITDLRQVALLAPTTKAGRDSIVGEYEAAFSQRGLDTYNPRAKRFTEDPVVGLLLGALLEILDPEGQIERVQEQSVQRISQGPRKLFSEYREGPLGRFVVAKRDKLHSLSSSVEFHESLLQTTYRFFAYEPFKAHLSRDGGPREAVSAWRMGRFTALLRDFEETQASDGLPLAVEKDKAFWVRRNLQPPASVLGASPKFTDRFFRDFLATLFDDGVDDPEDPQSSLPARAVPILTIHQAKGLEFPIVFVCGFQQSYGPGSEHHQEDLLFAFKKRPTSKPTSGSDRGHQDTLRQFFVAYSRAQWMLVLCTTNEIWASTDEQAYPQLPLDFKAATVSV